MLTETAKSNGDDADDADCHSDDEADEDYDNHADVDEDNLQPTKISNDAEQEYATIFNFLNV